MHSAWAAYPPMGSYSVYIHHHHLLLPYSAWKLILILRSHGGQKAASTWVVSYIPRRFTCPQTVTHPSSNRARRWATSLIETNALPLTTSRHVMVVHTTRLLQPVRGFLSDMRYINSRFTYLLFMVLVHHLNSAMIWDALSNNIVLSDTYTFY